MTYIAANKALSAKAFAQVRASTLGVADCLAVVTRAGERCVDLSLAFATGLSFGARACPYSARLAFAFFL